MNQQIIEEARQNIKNNCKYYMQYFLQRDLNNIFIFVTKIVEKQLLSINKFIYYVYYSISQMYEDFNLYGSLSKQYRKDLDFYHTIIVKIFMHLNAIFNELDKIKIYYKKVKKKKF